MRGFRVWSDYWEKYATEAELYMDGSADAVFEDDGGVPHHENTDLVLEFDTGLKDKNGKPIYEGDITNDGNHICIIRWSEHFTEFEAVNEGEGYASDIWYVAKYGEVIGNVHEDGDLLDDTED